MSALSKIRPITREYLDIHEYPTIHVETTQGNTLDFCGVEHSNDPGGYMIGRVRRELGDFLEKPSDYQKVVMLEGWRGPRTDMDALPEEEIIRRAGEEALGDRMTRRAGIEIASPEPPRDVEFAELCREFPSNEVFYWLVARQAVQWGREVPLPENGTSEALEKRRQTVQQKFDDLVDILSDSLGHVPSFQDIGTSFNVLADTHREMFGNEIDWHNLGHFDAHANPIDNNSVINSIHNRSNQIRDEYIANEIKKALDEGKDIFAIYGDGHAYTLEPVLKGLGE